MRLTTYVAAAAALASVAGAAELRLSGPYTHDNLSIYLVHGQDRTQKKYLTLAEAMQQGKVVVYETGSVNTLQVENNSNVDIYIQSGDIVKGGKQDRVLKEDIILPMKSGKVDVTSFCVEHGRWTQRGNESARAFASSGSALASPEMKRAVKDRGEQSEVWAQAAKAQAALAAKLSAPVASPASPSSYQLTLEAPKVRQSAEGYKKTLAGVVASHPDALGYVAAVNGKVTGADLYATHDLFTRMWPKMLEAVAIEAIAANQPDQKFTPPSMADVRAAATGYGARVSDEKQLNRRTNNVKADLPQGLVFETRDAEAPAAPVHRNYVTK